MAFNKYRKKVVQKHLGYFKKHKKFMEYALFVEKGWPIGSGVIEAACKSVVKQRMCRRGQGWSINGGQGILNQTGGMRFGMNSPRGIIVI